MRHKHSFRVLAVAAVIVMSAISITVASAMLLRCATACTGTVAGSAAAPPPAPAVVTIVPAPNARDVDPLAPVSVSEANGKLTAVQMINDAGKAIEAIMIYGVSLSNGLYGQEDTRVAFTIDDAHISIADDTTKQVSVYNNGTLVRTMPTSMGMGGTQQIGRRTLSFWTPPGIYTVLDKGDGGHGQVRQVRLDRRRQATLTDVTHVDNVVEGLVLGAQNGRGGEAYFVTDGEPVVFREFVSALLKTQGIDAPGRSIPTWVAGPLAAACEGLWRGLPLPGQPPLTRFVYWVSSQECTIDISKARRELGYRPVKGRAEGLAELAAAR